MLTSGSALAPLSSTPHSTQSTAANAPSCLTIFAVLFKIQSTKGHFLIPWLQTPYIFDIRTQPHTFSSISEHQVEKFGPLLKWVEAEFGFRPVVYRSFFGGKQDEGLVNAVQNLLKKTDDCELAVIDTIASAAHSLVIAIGVSRGRLNIEQAIELIRLEEYLQVDRWGLVEGGHDIDIADLRVEISSATVFLGLSRKR